MEDDCKGWEIQEYSQSGEPDENNKVTLRRIVRGGLRIGKTVFVTGVVISSAPFILPPLMVVSAVGLACSVPFGVFVASYACAEKLMSKLLPMPKPPPPLSLMLEYKGIDSLSNEDDIYDNELYDDDEVESNFPLQMHEDVDMEGVVDMEEEEGRLLEDTKADIEMRISLSVGEEIETVSDDKYYDGMAREEEQHVEEVYQEDDQSSAQQDEQSTAVSKTEISGSEIHPMAVILRQERPINNVNIDDSNLAHKKHEDIACEVVEVEGPYGLTTGVVEQITPEKEAGDAYQAMKSMTINLEESSKHKEPMSNTREDSESQFTAKQRSIITDEVHSTGVGGRKETPGVIETAIYTPKEETMKTTYVQKDDLEKQHVAADAASTTKRKKKGKKKKAKSEETTTEVTALKIHSPEQESAISSTVDVKNIMDEGRLNLVGDKKAGEETRPNTTVVDVVQPSESATTSRTPSGRSLKASQNQANFIEEKIWENIEALRTIVGYRVARHKSCMEELKALYIFTGVEPPMSIKSAPDVTTDSIDLDDVNDKLRFLMAIVGVK